MDVNSSVLQVLFSDLPENVLALFGSHWGAENTADTISTAEKQSSS